MEGKENPIDIFQLSNYVRPEIKEVNNKEYVMNGEKNSFYTYIIDRYNGSPTNRAIIDSYAKFIYGKGLISKQQAQKPLQFATVLQKLSKKDLRNICQDYAIFSEASYELIYKNNVLQTIKHVPKNQILPNKMNEEGEIEGYWFSLDFNQPRKYKPLFIPNWEANTKKNGSYIRVINSYQLGKTYFTDPVYMAGLPYAELEERVANFCINYITNDLSIGRIINMNQGNPESQEVRDRVKRAFKTEASGNTNAGTVFINWNDSKDTAITFDNLQIQDAYQQFEYLSKEASQKIYVSHKVVNPIIFGVKESAGLGNNADEMQVAFEETMRMGIQPMQEVILDDLMEIFTDEGISIDLDFVPLRQKAVQPTQLSKQNEVNDPIIADALIELGEEITEDWELIDEIEQKGEPQLTETAFKLALASVPSSFPNVKSEQDTSLFKIRYKYMGNQTPEREFCAKMMKASKVYRKEDIDLANTKIVNAGLGLKGADTYSIWLYKGGVNCKHFWQRQIYLRKGNNAIGVNEARRMILDLDPRDRPLAKWQENDPLVAQSASSSNNYFKAE